MGGFTSTSSRRMLGPCWAYPPEPRSSQIPTGPPAHGRSPLACGTAATSAPGSGCSPPAAQRHPKGGGGMRSGGWPQGRAAGGA